MAKAKRGPGGRFAKRSKRKAAKRSTRKAPKRRKAAKRKAPKRKAAKRRAAPRRKAAPKRRSRRRAQAGGTSILVGLLRAVASLYGGREVHKRAQQLLPASTSIDVRLAVSAGLVLGLGLGAKAIARVLPFVKPHDVQLAAAGGFEQALPAIVARFRASPAAMPAGDAPRTGNPAGISRFDRQLAAWR